ncbi:hypothetical protein PF001_g28615 [Phytophthora fragariae]|uniref:Uncharacterized protein n=2 Tax=Phytophthora fragariae TaxID=53985 RepID=A0A6A3DHQ8_9STRA|nr:hypothetical protein PF003_g36177 [Phytophthora fragariae]KAE8918100.1 hypothetical protein PF009_g31583 [Phytophthora fragariae]KAE8954087.1 hypothetical protein PF011_g32212 [Phytophthora fragariae]KAE9157643.1 hypothetical protein PF004_g32144 [Phytophthora fragariae]KAE9270893.1 hypothetical protein PF001_g28615 [Phytophthora fragariae]
MSLRMLLQASPLSPCAIIGLTFRHCSAFPALRLMPFALRCSVRSRLNSRRGVAQRCVPAQRQTIRARRGCGCTAASFVSSPAALCMCSTRLLCDAINGASSTVSLSM